MVVIVIKDFCFFESSMIVEFNVDNIEIVLKVRSFG